MKHTSSINTSKIVRKFPSWAKVDREINGAKIYNGIRSDGSLTPLLKGRVDSAVSFQRK